MGKKMAGILRNVANEIIGTGCWLYNQASFARQHDNGRAVVFDTSVGTDNLGDYIIMHYCNQVLSELFENKEYIHISTHEVPPQEKEQVVQDTKYKFVCGTNLLTSHIEQWWNWRLPDGFKRKLNYRNVILLGAGWGVYQDECSSYSKLIYRSMLNPQILHAVRDSYTEEKLKSAGIKNVINTGCPTMWRLTPEFCRTIPAQKAPDVITTITDYRRDIEKDNLMLEVLSRNYRRVYLWLQGKSDEEYLRTLKAPENLVIIPRSLEAYEERLTQGSVDYVGTRLHAGIFALNHKVRSIIIAVDNRAIEIAKDTDLPVVQRENMESELEQRILAEFRTDIKVNIHNILEFREQFHR